MKKLAFWANAFFDNLINGLAVLCGVMLIYLMLSITLDVIVRNLFNQPLPYTLDISEILLYAMTFFVAAWVLKVKGHVSMDIILQLFKPKHQALINAVTYIIGLIICIIIVWYGTIVTLDFYQRDIITGVMLKLPRAPLLAIIPFSFLLLSIQFIKMIIGYFRQWIDLRNQVN
jgi:C4-dicarboxylate transporter, DctQ subunit